MAEIAVNPFTMKDVVLKPTAGPDDYKAHVSRVRFEPTTTQVTWKGLSPNASFTDQGTPTWTCNIAVAQDWDNEDSFANYLLANAGDRVEFTFEPVAGGTGFTATLILSPPAIGGDVDATATAELTLGVVGAPVLVPVTP